jgi:hypothetical protein
MIIFSSSSELSRILGGADVISKDYFGLDAIAKTSLAMQQS